VNGYADSHGRSKIVFGVESRSVAGGACRFLTRGFGSRDERDAVCCGEIGEFSEGLDVRSGRLEDVPALGLDRAGAVVP
jgi:hypothetical protein